MKNLLKLSFLVLIMSSLLVTSCSKDDDVVVDDNSKVDFGDAPSLTISNGTVEVITEDKIRYHVLAAFGLTVTIAESETGVVVIDLGPKADYLPYFGPEIKAYADAIGKPISVIITHNHADHYGNIEYFASSPVYAEAVCADELAANPIFTEGFSGTINKVISSESETIGGLIFTFDRVSRAETNENGYCYLEEEKALFAEDLLYNTTHMYIREYTPLDGEDELTNWNSAITDLKARFGDYSHVFVGYGGTNTDVATTCDISYAYLTDAQGLIKGTKELTAGGYATTNQEVVDELEILYPNFEQGALNLSLPGTYGPDDPGAIWFP